MLLLASNAFALSCLWGAYDLSIQDGDVVPTNVELRFAHTFRDDYTRYEDEFDVAVYDADGEPVPSQVVLERNQGRLVFDAPLTPGQYTLDSTYLNSVAFEVGDFEDLDAPVAPQVIEARYDSAISEWGREAGVQIEVTGETNRFEYQIAETPDFDGAVTAYGNEYAYLGRGLCNASYEEYRKGRRYFVRVRAVDQADNVSDWVEVTPQRSLLGCSTTGGATGFGALLLGLLPLALRRR